MRELLWRLSMELVASLGPRPWQLLAVVLPLGASAAFALALAQPLRRCERGCEETRRIDRELDEADPELVVLGNSMARHAVVRRRLAAGLGVDPDRAAVVTIPGSSPGTWYAVARYRLFERGHRPRHVVVAAPSRAFWVTRPVVGADVAAQVAAAGTEDPVLLRVMGIGEGPARWWFRADLRRRLLRATAVRFAVGTGAVALALVGVPMAEEVDEELGANAAAPRNAFGGAAREGEVGTAEAVEAGFVPELAELARRYGARLTLARIPPRRGPTSAFLDDRPEADAALAAWGAAHGVPYHLLDDLALPERAYADAFHLTPDGAVRYTDALVAAMAEERP